MRNIGYYHSVLNGRIEIKLWSGRFLSFFSFLIKLLYIIHQKTPRTVKKKTEAPQVDVEGLSFPSYFRYSLYFNKAERGYVRERKRSGKCLNLIKKCVKIAAEYVIDYVV